MEGMSLTSQVQRIRMHSGPTQALIKFRAQTRVGWCGRCLQSVAGVAFVALTEGLGDVYTIEFG
jgi:hypothetical protein